MRQFLILGPALLAAALNAQMPEVVIRATTRLVQVNVIVTKNGKPVPGLKKEDFQVFDNGKRQEIRQFSEDTRAVLPASAEPLPPGTFTNQREQRSGTPAGVTAILLDGVNTSFASQSYARKQVIQFLQQIQPQDRIALYTLDYYQGLHVLHKYTTDSSDLVAKLAKYTGDVMPDVTGVSSPNDVLGGWQGGGGGGGGAQGSQERGYFLNNRVMMTLNAIEYIANNLATLPGRKNLIWISAAFPLEVGYLNTPRATRANSAASSMSGRPPAAGSNRSGIPSNPARYQNNWNPEADRAIRALNNANLAIYPVDARGLIASASANAALRAFRDQSTMLELAGRTGGRAFMNSNDIAGAVRTAVEDSAITYTLGFYPQNDKFNNSFHELKVKMVDLPHAELRYRKGYVDQAAPPQDESLRRAALADAVMSPMDANGMGLRAKVQQTSAGYDVTLRVDPSSILLDPQGDRWVGKMDLLFVQKDAHGRQVSGLDDTVSMELRRQSYDRVEKEGLIYHKVIPRSAGASELRVVARDASTGAVGSVSVPSSEIPAQP
jgi:VWFA-related protein